MSPRKILIIRFSSFGDIFQCMPCVEKLKDKNTTIHWLTRDDFRQAVSSNQNIDQVFTLKREDGLKGLMKIAHQLKLEGYTHIYDAHNNQRTFILIAIIAPFFKRWINKTKFVRRKKYRFKRFLWIKLKINLFAKPLRAVPTYIDPIRPWLTSSLPVNLSFKPTEIPFDSYICLAPSAAWDLKKWPTEYWKSLISKLADSNFVLLGGPDDIFCDEIQAAYPNRVLNLAGKASWYESMNIVSKAQLTIGNDTGITHFSDYLGRNTICIMGAATFCFPNGENTREFCSNLPCQPCTKDGRGQCKNTTHLKCLKEITPDQVYQASLTLLH